MVVRAVNQLWPVRGGIYDPELALGFCHPLEADFEFLLDADSHTLCRGPFCSRADALIIDLPIHDLTEDRLS